MKLLQLDKDNLQEVFLTESGMDFAIVNGDCDAVHLRSDFVVRGNGYAAPIDKYEDIYSLADMYEGLLLPDEGKLEVTTLKNTDQVSKLTSVLFPLGYLPAHGAHQLLGALTLKHNTRFFRFTSGSTDPKFDAQANSLSKDTYLSTQNDQSFVNSGFGAVGRYALPLPVPASYKHDYTIPAGTKLLVGTVAPQFGQAGGGVEVKTVSKIVGVQLNNMTKIDDC